MKIQSKYYPEIPNRFPAIALPLFEGGRLPPEYKAIDRQFDRKIVDLMKSGSVTGKPGEITVLYGLKSQSVKVLLLVGVGKKLEFSADGFAKAAGALARKANSEKISKLLCVVPNGVLTAKAASHWGRQFAQAMHMGTYKYSVYKSEKADKPTLKTVVLGYAKRRFVSDLEKGASEGNIVGEAVNRARDLANTPANDLTPKIFMEKAKALVKAYPVLKLELIDKTQAKKLKMDAFLGVARGSVLDPYIVILRYNGGKKNEKPLALVGKGVTFDSGGISIKPSLNMGDMKADMSGGAAVFATMEAIAQLRPSRSVMAVIPLVENMPSANAQRPGDVITAMNGTTIEVTNTDAEGRLILADALCYAVKQGVSEIIDIATLTGACSVALGDAASAVLGNRRSMVRQLLLGSHETGEKLWELPLLNEYAEYMKSDIADILNAQSNRMAGTASAAKFLERFVAKTPWAHLDIASTMQFSATKGYTVKGMSGSGVRTLIHYVMGHR